MTPNHACIIAQMVAPTATVSHQESASVSQVSSLIRVTGVSQNVLKAAPTANALHRDSATASPGTLQILLTSASQNVARVARTANAQHQKSAGVYQATR